MAAPWSNPVLRRELQVRVRTWRPIAALTAYLAICALIVYVVYETQRVDASDPFVVVSATEAAVLGRRVFDWLVLAMLALIFFVVPGLVAGSITGERERESLVPLQVTLLRARSIVFGKLAASLAFVTLMVVATAPLLSLAFLLGGVSFARVVLSIGVVLVVAVVLAAVSIWCSSIVRRTQAATVLAYGLVLLLGLGTFAVYGAVAAINEDDRGVVDRPPRVLLAPNPVMLAADLLSEGEASRFGGLSSPFNALDELTEDEDVFAIGAGGRLEETQNRDFWPLSLSVLGAITALCLVGASRRLRVPAEGLR